MAARTFVPASDRRLRTRRAINAQIGLLTADYVSVENVRRAGHSGLIWSINEAALSEVPQARFAARAANCACSSTVILRTSHETAGET
jgi:hypothetical protein